MRWFEVCKTSKLPARRRVYSFCFCKKNQKARAACFLGRGRRPDAPGNAAKRQEFNLDCTVLQLRYADLRFAKPHKFLKRNGFTFFSLLRKERGVAEGPRPSRLLGTVQNSIDYVFSWHFRLSSLNRVVVQPAFPDVLNRCERVTVVQTQDRYFSKMGCRTASLQEQAAFEKGSCSLSLLRWEFVFSACWFNV